jgi:dTDP-4-dehydrorhamnose 3,5-epimerase
MHIQAVRPLPLAGLQVIRFTRFRDARGYFTETFRRGDVLRHPEVTGLGGALPIVQCNESYSRPGVVRGLHFQWDPFMGKLVRTIAGHMLDLVLDIRLGSPTFGRIMVHDMPAAADDPEGEWLWVPPGFAHGNLFLEPTVIEYLCTGEYNHDCEAGISPLAPDLDWSLCPPALRDRWQAAVTSSDLIITDKDRGGLTLAAWTADPRSREFVYGRAGIDP